MKRIKVGVLGATGMVGQRFVSLLSGHPWFEVAALAASDRSVGRRYGEVAPWRLAQPLPEELGSLPVVSCQTDLDCEIVFSALDSSVAGEIEAAFAHRGCWVFSNAKHFRMAQDVPLIVPEINPGHLSALDEQRRRRGWTGAIVTNPNCSAILLALTLGPLHEAFSLRRVHVVTLQAVSGAGYPGVPAMDALANVLPWIEGEEEKIERETKKILSKWTPRGLLAPPIEISAQANRVPVENGHLECVSIETSCEVEPSEIQECWKEFRGRPQDRALPSAPERPVCVAAGHDRPQPRLDIDAGKGMSVTVGRVRRCPILSCKYVLVGHNTIRGAAGASILNAEMAFCERMRSQE